MKNNLNTYRKELGLSLQEMADRCGTSKGNLHLLESRESNPTLATAYAIAAVLQCEVEDIWPNQVEVEIVTNSFRRVVKD